jgi:hypothetical protein
MRVRLVSLGYRTASVIALLIGALGLVGLVISQDDRVVSVAMIGVGGLISIVAYRTRQMLVPRSNRSARKKR